MPQFRLILAQNRHCQGLSAHCERDGAEQAAAHGSPPWQPMPRLDAGARAESSVKAPGSGASLRKLGGALIGTLSLSKAGLYLVGRWSRLQLCSHLPSQSSGVQHGPCWAGRTAVSPCVLQWGQRGGCAVPAGGDAGARGAAHFNCGYP